MNYNLQSVSKTNQILKVVLNIFTLSPWLIVNVHSQSFIKLQWLKVVNNSVELRVFYESNHTSQESNQNIPKSLSIVFYRHLQLMKLRKLNKELNTFKIAVSQIRRYERV